MIKILLAGAAGALVLGAVGFVFGAGVPDERAGEVAVWAGVVGAGVGFVLGAGGAWLWLRR